MRRCNIKNVYHIDGRLAHIEVFRYPRYGDVRHAQPVSRHEVVIDASRVNEVAAFAGEWVVSYREGVPSVRMRGVKYGKRTLFGFLYGKAAIGLNPASPFDLRRGRVQHHGGSTEVLHPALTPDPPPPTSDWERRVAAYRGIVYGVAIKNLRNRPPEVLNDVVQETFVRSFVKIDQFSGDDGEYKNWVCRIARNLCIDIARREKVLVLEPLTTLEDEKGDAEDAEDRAGMALVDPNAPDPQESVAEESRVEELRRRFYTVWPRLSDTHREVLRLHYIEGLSCEAIGERHGLRSAGVKSRLYRAREAFKEAYIKVYGPGNPFQEMAA